MIIARKDNNLFKQQQKEIIQYKAQEPLNVEGCRMRFSYKRKKRG